MGTELQTRAPRRSPTEDPDQRVLLHGARWEDYERLLEIRGESARPRIIFLAGELELMSPSHSHEELKKTVARLVEAYADEFEIDLSGAGSWTLKSRPLERGLEPDECYYLLDPAAPRAAPDRPTLAIEVIWTSGGIGKLEVYRGLGVREVWFVRYDGLRVFMLEDAGYREVLPARSLLLPNLDLSKLLEIALALPQPVAVRTWRRWLRGE